MKGITPAPYVLMETRDCCRARLVLITTFTFFCNRSYVLFSQRKGVFFWYLISDVYPDERKCNFPFCNFYRPQTEFAKVMFSQVFVCPQWGVSVQGLSVQWGSLSKGRLSGGSMSGGVSGRETPRTVTCGRYTSYWNAFLSQYIY